jgi:hypothetical protein
MMINLDPPSILKRINPGLLLFTIPTRAPDRKARSQSLTPIRTSYAAKKPAESITGKPRVLKAWED